ncbi:T6SS immunity protein Tli4 family protein [Caballeronia humi]|uniref:T6SS immunity protein Tli4 family protein n=1 Tax=Caballeronia humi TaxID=326474 RepID=UPI000B3E94F4|nr:T6SS immunity protein Tli4 family protein [Caballeronia humi]
MTCSNILAAGADDDIPTEPGVCFLNGFLPGKATDQENVYAGFVLRDKPDVSFVLQTDSNIREQTTLLQRGTSVNQALKQRDGRTIRKGHVALAGMQAEEWLAEGMTTAAIRGHHFGMEANSKTGSAQSPLISLEMDNGGIPPDDDPEHRAVKASLTEGEAVGLWDAISRTLRTRPNAF